MVKICKHFGDCGGCACFEEDYEHEARLRQERASEVLTGFFDGWSGSVDLQHELPRHHPRHFRNRVLYPIQPHPRKGLVAGLYRQGSHELVEIETCETQDPDLTALARIALRIAKEMKLQAWDEKSGKGFLRAMDLRVMESTGDALFTIVTTGGLWGSSAEFAKELASRAQQIERKSGRYPFRLQGVLRNLNDEMGNRVLGRRSLPLLGRDYQLDRVGKPLPRAKRDRIGVEPPLWFRISAGSFYQSHKKADMLLYQPIFRSLGSLDGKRIVDAYAGVGSFGLRAARAGAERVELIEDNPRAMKDAVENFRRNGHCDQADFKLAGAALGMRSVEPNPHLLILDPPRAGLMQDGVEAVHALNPELILYVSCHMESLARDLALLTADGPWGLQSMAAADIFPRTRHLEFVTLLAPR